MNRYKIFEFTKYVYEAPILKLYYLVDGNIEFIEEINFNPNNLNLRTLNDNEKKALDLSFRYLHFVAGISYYKALLPEKIKIDMDDLNDKQAKFFDELYFNGLGEFSFKNQVKLNIEFPFSKNAKNEPINISLNNDFIVPIGGGKDSVVTLEMLRKLKNTKLYTFSVNTARPIGECVKLADCDNILVKRTISPKLLEINKDLEGYGAYNGHVPITAIIAFISVCTGIIYNCNTTIISNERSANVGNREYNGVIVNHQWSKSVEAEKMVNRFIKEYITPAFTYFSLLRPIYEIHIAKLFSKIGKYDAVFSSCNKNFKIVKDGEPKRWCCDCDKCRFVFLILACFMNRNHLIEIFGENLLNDEKQFGGYKELVGLSGCKPFECVGEIEESQLAFYLLQKTEFKNDYIVKEIFGDLSGLISNEKFREMEEKYMGVYFENTEINDQFIKLYNE